MEKKDLLNRYSQDSQERSFFASALDKYQQAQQRQQSTHTGFFNEEERERFTHLLEAQSCFPYQWEGGYPSSLRQVCCFLPPWQEELDQVPLSLVEVAIKGEVSHRDVLGSLMGLGITRRKIGDILLTGTACQVLVTPELVPILLSQWTGVGRYGISLEEVPLTALNAPPPTVKDIFTTVASLRLDSLLATGFSLPRSKANQLILAGKVQVNHRSCTKPDHNVQEGDLLSCRGWGKCQISQVGGQSKKGRTQVSLQRFM